MNRSLLALIIAVVTIVCVADISYGYVNIGIAPNYGTLQPLDGSRSAFTRVNDAGRRAGLRVGDILDSRAWGARERLYLLRLGYATAGTTMSVPYFRGPRSISVEETFQTQSGRGVRDALDVLLRVLLAASGILLLARGKDWGSIAAGLTLCGTAVFEGFGVAYVGPSWLVAFIVTVIPLAGIASYLGRFLFGIYLLPSRVPRALRAALWVVFAAFWLPETALSFGRFLAAIYSALPVANTTIAYSLLQALASIAIVLAFGVVAAYVRGREGSGVRILFAAVLIGSLGGIFNNLFHVFGQPAPLDGAANLTYLAVAIAFPYAVLAKRVVAVDFVINKAAIYTVVLTIVVGIFILAEQLIERAALGRVQSFAFELLVPLILGLSIKWIEAGVERIIERVLYRDKLRAEQELEALIEDFPHARDVRILASRVASEVHRNMHVPYVAIYREEEGTYVPIASAGHGAPLPIGADDPVFMRLRSKHKVVQAEDFATALPHHGAVFPLVVFGTVTGAVYCQFRESGERFDPDELQTLGKLSHELAIALLWVERESPRLVGAPAT